MTGTLALFISLVVLVLSVFTYLVIQRLALRITALEAQPKVDGFRFALPPEQVSPISFEDVPEGLDVTGAWALEQQRAGIHVSDKDIEMFRQMRMAEGL